MSKIINAHKKLQFFEILEEMKHIKRATILEGGRRETNAEHSYDLAFMVLLFGEDFKEELDLEKCYRMALLHDIVEIYAGDTVIFDEKMEATKKQREKASLEKIENLLGKDFFKEYKKIIEEYETGETLEAKFVRQIDKLHPIIITTRGGGATWREYKMQKHKLIEKKRSQIDNTFGLRDILDSYFEKAEKEGMFWE
ncbi:hypothetical protein CSB09_04215 [Candidatus Gracilibacteria bacterium]|nr:MAG: hypothetical protein CSB09_04215 [Candidatus Gracilibacteria bacterium]